MRKYITVLIIISMLTVFTVPAYADYNTNTNISTGELEKAICEMEEQVWEDLYNQLEAQDALGGIEYFKNALRPEIRKVIYERYGVEEFTTLSTNNPTFMYYFPNGGAVSYTGSLNTENIILFLNEEGTKLYYFDNTFTFGDLITAVVSFGFVLVGYNALAKLAMNYATKQEVEDNGFYSKVMSISWGAGAESGTYIYAWDNHPHAYVYEVNSIVDVDYFA